MAGARALAGRLRARPIRAALAGLALLIVAAAWAWAAHALWHSTVPSSLRAPHLDVKRLFGASFLQHSSSYTRFLDVNAVLSLAALLVVLALYARRGHRLMRESAAGPIGTGMLLGMLGFALVWLAEAPFQLAGVWWERRHHVSHQGYLAALAQSFLSLGATFVFVSLALLVAMGLARVLRGWWWTAAVPIFTGLALLSAFLSVYLIPSTHALRDPRVAADARALARVEGVAHTRVLVQRVARFTTAPNAEAVGFGSTRAVVLWDTLLDGRFTRRQIDVVVAHELGHLAHHHTLKRVGWLALFLIPATALVAWATARRGGLHRPEAVPLALFVFIALQVVSLPLVNVVSRHEEAEADWSALRATRAPDAARELFRRLAVTSRAAPNPPSWSYVLFAGHPTIVQRIAMAEAFARRGP